MVVDPTGVKVPVKFGNSRSNHSRDIRLPHFVTNDDNDDAGRYDNRFLPKNQNVLFFKMLIHNLTLWKQLASTVGICYSIPVRRAGVE